MFSLYRKEDVNEDGSIKPAALEPASKASGGEGSRPESDEEPFDEEKAIDAARRKLSGVDPEGAIKTSLEDVD